MSKPKDPYLPVERPESKAIVDFLSDNVSVEIEVSGGKIRVKAKAMASEDAYTWDEHEVEWDLPEKEPPDEDE